MTSPSIAIVGAGFSGLLTAVQLARRLPQARLRLIEKGPRFAEGAAYATREAQHVLNVRLENMSAFPDDPDHLTRWLATQLQWSAQGPFITRGDYGRYLRGILSEALQGAPGRIELIHDEAISAEQDAGGWRLGFHDRAPVEADILVLALGNPAPADPPGLDEGLTRSTLYIADPWRRSAALSDAADKVLLIGSSLTMVDVVLSHARPGRSFVALSRRGLTPRAHKTAAVSLPAQTYKGSPLAVLRQVRRLALKLDWRAVADDLRRSAPRLWRSWTPAQRKQFLRHLRPIWDVHRHRLAPSVANRLHSLIGSGDLTIKAGRIVKARVENGRVLVTWRGRGAGRASVERFDAVINCTGPGVDLRNRQSPLIEHLAAEGHLRSDPAGLGFDVDDECRLRSTEGEVQADLYAVGPMTRGAFWEITAVPDIRLQAAEVAAKIALELSDAKGAQSSLTTAVAAT